MQTEISGLEAQALGSFKASSRVRLRDFNIVGLLTKWQRQSPSSSTMPFSGTQQDAGGDGECKYGWQGSSFFMHGKEAPGSADNPRKASEEIMERNSIE